MVNDQYGFAHVAIEGVSFIHESGYNEIGVHAENLTGFSTPYWKHLSNKDRNEYIGVFNVEKKIAAEMNTDVGGIKAKMLMRGNDFGVYTDLLSADDYNNINGAVVMETEAQIDLLIHNIVLINCCAWVDV